jgi:hypothetical protein
MTQGYPLTPPFYLTASYQTSQYGSQGSLYTPNIPSVFQYLVNPPATGVASETADNAVGQAVGWVADAAVNEVQVITLYGAPTSGTFVLVFGDVGESQAYNVSTYTTGQVLASLAGTSVTSQLAYNATSTQVATALNALATIGTQDKWTVALPAGTTGGTFQLTFGGQTTSTLPWNASASTIQAALQALSSVGAGNIGVTSYGFGYNAPWTITFTGTLTGLANGNITSGTTALTGGASAVVLTHVTTGGPNVSVAGSAGGPYTVTFINGLAGANVQQIGADGSQLVGPTTPYNVGNYTYTAPIVVVTTTVQGHAAFSSPYAPGSGVTAGTAGAAAYRPAILNTEQQYDPMKNVYDTGGGNYSGSATPNQGPLW